MLINDSKYDFLRNQNKLSICYITYGGSHAYGTAIETSDIDIRGFGIGTLQQALLHKECEQIEDKNTDTIIYGFLKYIELLKNCNPNVLEMLGTREEDILYCNELGRILKNNIDLFLCKQVFYTFGGYATQQLRRLQNAMAANNDIDYKQNTQNTLYKSLNNMLQYFYKQYDIPEGSLSFTFKDDDIRILIDIKDFPVQKLLGLSNDIRTTVQNFNKLNHRNNKKDLPHMYKHAMHLVRLNLMGIDILNGEGLITYREKDLPLLMQIRNGNIPLVDVLAMADELEIKLKKAYKKSKLPNKPQIEKIDKLVYEAYTEQ